MHTYQSWKFYLGFGIWWHFKNIKNEGWLSYSFTMETPCSQSLKHETIQRFLNVRSNIKNNIWFYFHISLKIN
jgi:hypothetical protein